MSYKIGSFNLYKFSYQSDKEINKDIYKIAEIISSEGFDIVALQEVLNPNVLKLLIGKLGYKWRYRWEQPKIGNKYSNSAQEAEGYAFIWNSDTMELSWTQDPAVVGNTNMKKRVAEPHIYNQYRIDSKAGELKLARNPYYGRFKPIRGFCEIRLINTHFYFGDNYACSILKRKKELDILIKKIYHNISDRRYGNNLPAYTIILGDYNLNIKRPWTHLPFLVESVVINDEGRQKHIITVQDQLTTLKRSVSDKDGKEEDDKNLSNRGFANNYDHFSYDVDRFRGTKVKTKRIDTVRKYENDDFVKHRKEISDHIPIVLELNLNKYDIE